MGKPKSKTQKKESHKDILEFHPRSLMEMRTWFRKNYAQGEGLWVILPKKGSSLEGITLSDLVDESICWGWIDSLPRKVDEKRYKLYISPRSPKSNWSKVNKEKVERLEKENRIQEPGRKLILLAKEKGTWTALDSIEALELPIDLLKEFQRSKIALQNFEAFPKSVKRGILEWIAQAKKKETRANRIQKTVSLAEKNQRANQFLY